MSSDHSRASQSHEEGSTASSAIPSHASTIARHMIPHHQYDIISDPDSWFLDFLKVTLGLQMEFLTRLVELGWVLPSIIVNKFGLSNHEIATSFAIMGMRFVIPKRMQESTTNLVIFSRNQVLNYRLKRSTAQKKGSWQKLRKKERRFQC